METPEIDGTRQKLSALIDFSNLINSNLDLKFILDNLLLTCFGKFHTTRGCVAILNADNLLVLNSYKGIQKKNANEFPRLKISAPVFENAEQAEEFRKNGTGILLDEKFTGFLNDNKLVLVLPVISSLKLRGFVLLGERFGHKDYTQEDLDFLSTILNVASTAIENSLFVDQLKSLNRNLDSKVSMLTSLFELSKEFSGILDTKKVCRLMGFTIMGQMLVSSYAIVLCKEGSPDILESKFPGQLIISALNNCEPSEITSVIKKTIIGESYPDLFAMGVELIIPMQIHAETKGLVILGKRFNASGYNDADIDFLYAMASLAIVSIENSRLFKEALEKQKMEDDLEIARQIQRNLLPSAIPEMKNFEIAALNISSRQVGGDYYDLIKLDDNELLFAIGDVAGKGVPASLMMANLQAFLKSICKQGMRIEQATALLNDLVSENTVMGSFITFFWGIINDEMKTLNCVNAGHNPPLLVTKEGIKKLTEGGMILGILKTMMPYKSEIVQVNSGDMLVLFTDGITEAMNIKLEEFSDERLEELVPSLRDMSAQQALDTIIGEVNKYVDGAAQSDDITIMIIKVK